MELSGNAQRPQPEVTSASPPVSNPRPFDGVAEAIFICLAIVSAICMACFFGLYALPMLWDVYFLPFYIITPIAAFFSGAAGAVSYCAAIYLVFSRTWWPWRIAIALAVTLTLEFSELGARFAVWNNDDLITLFLSMFVGGQVFWAATVSLLWFAKHAFGWRLHSKRFEEERPRLAIWHFFVVMVLAGLAFSMLRFQMSLDMGERSASTMNMFGALWSLGGLAIIVSSLWTILRFRSLPLALVTASAAPLGFLLIFSAVAFLMNQPNYPWLFALMHNAASTLSFTLMIWVTVILMRNDGRRLIVGGEIAPPV